MNEYLKWLYTHPKKLTEEEERELFQKAQQGDIEARNEIVEAYLRLVVSIARRYSGQNIMDLIQEGNIGLMRAVEKFNPSLGYQFSTFAIWEIRQTMSRAIVEKSKIIRIPNTAMTEYNRLQKVIRRRETFGEPIDLEILSQELGWSEEKIKNLLEIPNKEVLSLEAPADDEENCLMDMLEADDVFDPTKGIQNEELMNVIRKVLLTLTNQEREVLSYRFGFADGRSWSLENLGAKMGLTREKVRTIEKKALRKLRHPSRAKIIKNLLA